MQTSSDPKRGSVLINMETSSDHIQQDKLPRHCVANHITCIFSMLLLLTLATSLAALGVSIAALTASESRGARSIDEWSDQEMDTTTLYQVEAMLEGMGEMTFEYAHDPVDERLENMDLLSNRNQRRNIDADNENSCSSSNETDAKPLAHIIGPHTTRKEAIPNAGANFVVLTKQWQCKSESGKLGLVQGGMTFHQSSGFLELPTSGVYFVYQQVVFGIRDSEDRVAKSRLVACVPGVDCSYFADAYMQTEANLEAGGRYGTSKSQGGLFHFPAGTQIAILAFNERHNINVNAITYDNSGYQTYMGAFLVDEDK